MRQTLFRLLLLVGFLVALVPADTSAQPVKVGEELQKANLQKAQVKAEASKIAKRGNFKVKQIPGVTDRPLKQLAGTRSISVAELQEKKSKAKSLQPTRAAVTTASTEPSFNWSESLGSAFPVQNQLQCGSCWIFSAISGLNANIVFKNKNAPADPSEQYVLAGMFRETGNPCSGGWPDQPLKFLKVNGTFSRKLFPYDLSNQSQPALQTDEPPFKALDWGYVGNGDAGIPSKEELKQAIAMHGSVVTTVWAGEAFKHYEKGIFGTDDFTKNEINHAITLIGWDDNPDEFTSDPALKQGTGGGVWILRNSWGTDWGVNGNMRIAYITSNIGYGAMWVDAKVPIPDDKQCPAPSQGNQQEIEKRIQFYEKNYKQYLPK